MRFGISGQRFVIGQQGAIVIAPQSFDLSDYYGLVIGSYVLSIHGRILVMENPDA